MKKLISTVIAGLIVFAACSTPDTSSHVKAGSSVKLTTTTTVDTICNMEDVLGSQGAAEYLSENAEIYASASELEGWAMVIDTLCN